MELKTILSKFKGKKCWMAGHSYGTMFIMKLGKKVWDDTSKTHDGEYFVLVQTSDWEIFQDGKSIAYPTSSDREKINKDLEIFVGRKIENISFTPKKRQVELVFQQKVKLVVREDEDIKNSKQDDDYVSIRTPSHRVSFGNYNNPKYNEGGKI